MAITDVYSCYFIIQVALNCVSSVYNKSIKDHLYKWYLLSGVDWHLDWYPWSTLNPLIDNQSKLHWHLSWQSLDTKSTLDQHVSQESAFVQTLHSWPTLSRLSTDHWSSVNWDVDGLSIEYKSGCQLCVDWDVNQRLIEDIDWHSTADAFITSDFIIKSTNLPQHIKF